jgi:hypothetical protein
VPHADPLDVDDHFAGGRDGSGHLMHGKIHAG